MLKQPSSESRSTPKRLSPEARRSQLLDMAIIAFAAAGIERAVHADVAKLANVSTPTVFTYFPTRDALVDAVLNKVETTIIEMIAHIPEQSELPADEMLRSLAQALDALCDTQPDLMKIALAWSVSFTEVRARYIAFQEQQLNMLSARLSPTSEERSDARITLGVALLFIQMHFDGSPEEVRQRYVDRVIDLMGVTAQT